MCLRGNIERGESERLLCVFACVSTRVCEREQFLKDKRLIHICTGLLSGSINWCPKQKQRLANHYD